MLEAESHHITFNDLFIYTQTHTFIIITRATKCENIDFQYIYDYILCNLPFKVNENLIIHLINQKNERYIN